VAGNPTIMSGGNIKLAFALKDKYGNIITKDNYSKLFLGADRNYSAKFNP
jgi:hypothetical protein